MYLELSAGKSLISSSFLSIKFFTGLICLPDYVFQNEDGDFFMLGYPSCPYATTGIFLFICYMFS